MWRRDADGICDDEDDCVGAYDECGVCNGDGIAEGACDCDGNVLDALGVCGGDCESDANGNGICDSDELPGCTDSIACNYDASATQEDGSCDYCSCLQSSSDYTLTVESSAAVAVPGATTYKFYVNMTNASDRMSL